MTPSVRPGPVTSDETPRGAPSRPPISVVMPAYNEAAAVGDQVRAIRQALDAAAVRHEIIVVDDGSEDRTAQEALWAGARVLQHPVNRGYGAAIKSGIVAAKHEIVVITDADGTYPVDEISPLVDQLAHADMAVGARIGAHVKIPWVRRPAKWILGGLARRIAGRKIPDLNSGLRAFRRECVLQYFPILSNRFSFTTTVTLAYLADDYRVTYHPIDYYRRIGTSKIRSRNFMDFVILVLRMAMLFQPLKIFVPLALACGALGLLKLLFDIVAMFPRAHSIGWPLLLQPAVSTSAILFLLMALEMLLIGMVADGLLRRIAQHYQPAAPSYALRVSELASPAILEDTFVLEGRR